MLLLSFVVCVCFGCVLGMGMWWHKKRKVTRINAPLWGSLMLDFVLDIVWLGVSYFSIGVMPLQPVYVLGQVTAPSHPPPTPKNITLKLCTDFVDPNP